MLIQFRFENFKSFDGDTMLHMEATNNKDFKSCLVKIGNTNILPFATIYGANSSGKTNIVEAFSYMNEFIKDSSKYGKDGIPFKFHRAKPFLFDEDSSNEESEFEVAFTMPHDRSGKQYVYGFCIDDDGVVEEWLSSKKKSDNEFSLIFYRFRKENELDLSGLSKADADKIKNTLNDESLIVSVGADLDVDICKRVEKWFFSNRIIFFSNMNTAKDLMYSVCCPANIESDKNVQEEVAAYMNYFGNNVKGFEVRRVLTLDNNDMLEVLVLHQKKESDGVVKIPLKNESIGFRKLFMAYRFIQDVLNTGGVLFTDDLDANLHTLSLRYLYLLFLDKTSNKYHSQLITTTHDAWFLSNPMFRSDEVWFTEKNENGSSTLYSLADFKKIRDSDPDGIHVDTGEKYMVGCYGAIPRFYDTDNDKTDNRLHRLPRSIAKHNKNK